MSNEQDHRLALRPGTVLNGKYKLISVLGHGGFGITYLAEDASLGRKVAIKEMLPNDFAMRDSTSAVVPKTKGEAANLQWALQRFIEEARVLARFDHPNIVRIHEQFRANQTAYMVTAFEEGRELNDFLRSNGLLNLRSCGQILLPVLDGLEKVHEVGILHRDIKPGNLYIAKDIRPVLLDFGSARLAVGAKTKDITTIVTPKYAPFEQYHSTGNLGPWTDIYSMAAVMHKAITGSPPPEAPKRERDDPYRPLVGRVNHLPNDFLAALDWALNTIETKRPQTVAEWCERLKPVLGQAGSDSNDEGDVTREATIRHDRISAPISSGRPSSRRTQKGAPRTVYTAGPSTPISGDANTGRARRRSAAVPVFLVAMALALTGLGLYYFNGDKDNGSVDIADARDTTAGNIIPTPGPSPKPQPEPESEPEPKPKPAPEPPVPQPKPSPTPTPIPPAPAPDEGRTIMLARGQIDTVYTDIGLLWDSAHRHKIYSELMNDPDANAELAEDERKKIYASRSDQVQVQDENLTMYYNSARKKAMTLIGQQLPAAAIQSALEAKRVEIDRTGRENARSTASQHKLLKLTSEFIDAEKSGAFFLKDDLVDRALEIDPKGG